MRYSRKEMAALGYALLLWRQLLISKGFDAGPRSACERRHAEIINDTIRNTPH